MKKILILGANPETVSLIKKAKEMGLYTIVTDYNPDAYAKKFADQAINIDAMNVDALEQFARNNQVSAVAVGVAEALLPAYCELCERLGLPCYSTKDKFEIMVRKDYFKAQCRNYNVPTIREYSIEDKEKIIYPVIVKPVDSCSSKGIKICHNPMELNQAIEYALKFSRSGKYLIEEYMSGDEVISYYVMQDGTPIFVGMCDRYTHKDKDDLVQLPNCYIFPSRHIDSYMTHSDDSIKKMIKGLGLNNGSIFFQCFVDSEGVVRTYEPGYRLNGAQEHIIISKVSDIDAKELYLNLAISGKVANKDLQELSNPKPNRIACKLSPLIKTGRIDNIEGLEEIEMLPDVISVNPSYVPGDVVDGEGTLKQIVCRFFVISENKKALIDTINNIYSLLKVENQNGEDMLIGRFDTETINHLY
ncbi:MAG: ATP-grasp domain-containing protein [Lachnospiraceae bacterium]|nr:ATP-grasp domain-containing protein [Lachnospiraceae bacterium]